ncbi:HD domain-containing protein [Thermodesulfovibrio hydrogeniphilus]
MEPLEIIIKFYDPKSKAYQILVNHSKAVAEKALRIAEKFEVDKNFIYEAAMLHDIGIFMTNTPKLDCHGSYPYIAHGYLGRQLLEGEGLVLHALVCERHTGVGITKEEIIKNNLPLPQRDMLPVSLEEKIIAYADKFFSKEADGSVKVRSVDEILKDLSRYGEEKVKTFKEWMEIFEGTAL